MMRGMLGWKLAQFTPLTKHRFDANVEKVEVIPVMALQHVLHYSISLAKEVWGAWFQLIGTFSRAENK